MEIKEDLEIKEDVVDNTTGIVRELDYPVETSLARVLTLLGPQFRLPRAGVIRPGIMVLKPGCSKEDQRLYEKLVKEDHSWDEIDKMLGPDKGGKSKLMPHNVGYFTIHKRDLKNPGDAETIYKLYADPDGNLRSIPVIFPINEWWNIMPHSLRCFSKSKGLLFRSTLKEVRDKSGKIIDVKRVCEYPLPVVKGRRIFGGRQWGERICDPLLCMEYQNGSCSFGGALQFYIPGIKGIGIWVVPTTSYYSLISIKSTLEMVAKMGGKIAGLFDGRPIFVLKKVQDTVSRIDPTTGNPVLTKQWLIYLDVDVDMAELALFVEKTNVIARGRKAISDLSPGSKDVKGIKSEQTVPEITDRSGPQEKEEGKAHIPENAPPGSEGEDDKEEGKAIPETEKASPPPEEEGRVLDFKSLRREEKEDLLKDMMWRKGIRGIKKPFSSYSEEELVNQFRDWLKLPDKNNGGSKLQGKKQMDLEDVPF